MCEYFQTLAKTSLLLLHFLRHMKVRKLLDIYSQLFFLQNLSLFSLRLELITVIINLVNELRTTCIDITK